MELSYVIVSHNRRATLLRTLDILQRTTPIATGGWEAWVVDNGSTDGSADAVAAQYPQINLIRRKENEGVWARSLAFAHCRGRYAVLLDDDSYPSPPEDWQVAGGKSTTVSRSIGYLDAHPRCAAVVGRCVLPSGRAEACALPGVMLSGAVCIRREALEQVGGFRREFFRKAGEYDLSYRLWQAGWSVERFEDLEYRHDKHAGGRSAALAFKMDLRNNLILVERFFPPTYRRAYRKDYLQRYAAFARHHGHEAALSEAVAEARQWASRERDAGRQTLSPVVLETLLMWGRQKRRIAEWSQRHDLRRVVIADCSKNLYATFRATRRCGLCVTSIADNHPALAGLDYRGVPVRPDREALSTRADGVVLSNVNPAQVGPRAAELSERWAGPVLTLWTPRALSPRAVRAGAA
ncbi:MAG: glycosyltransferase [Planctomycetota bacterium]